MNPWHRSPHADMQFSGTTGTKGIRFALAFLALALVLVWMTGCVLPGRENQVQPTLVPTLALVIPPSPTATLSPTPAPDTPTPPPSDTPLPTASATITITPWVPDTATPGPSPTITRTPTFTRTPTRTRIPTRTRTITPTPTITLTPTPPAPVMNIVRPGLLSRVISPIQMELNVNVGHNGKLVIELVGEDGRLIASEVKNFGMDQAGRRIWLVPDLPFEIDAAAETARLQVTTQDEFGRVEGIGSVDVVLLAVGRNEINPPKFVEEPYLIRRPRAEAEVEGGTLRIEGLARPVNDSPLFIDLLTEDNQVISTNQIEVAPPEWPLSHTPFTLEIPYRVDGPTSVRVVVYQSGSRIPGIVALTSRLVTLLP